MSILRTIRPTLQDFACLHTAGAALFQNKTVKQHLPSRIPQPSLRACWGATGQSLPVLTMVTAGITHLMRERRNVDAVCSTSFSPTPTHEFRTMQRILVTGATGQVGSAVIASLLAHGGTLVRAAVRDTTKKTAKWSGDARVQLVAFDYSDPASQDAAFADCDSLFLLRPPQLTEDFGDLIARARQHGVAHIVFLSVQGVERNPFIPHHKIEQRLVAGGVPYTLLRPAYFMQNFTSTLRAELVRRHRIFLPAGNARFTLVDVDDIARVAAQVLTQPGTQHHGQAYTLTSQTPLSFQQMADQLTTGLGTSINYVSPNPWRFYRTLRSDGGEPGLILVMLLLHLLPRYTGTPPVTQTVFDLTGQWPVEFAHFVSRHRDELQADFAQPP